MTLGGSKDVFQTNKQVLHIQCKVSKYKPLVISVLVIGLHKNKLVAGTKEKNEALFWESVSFIDAQ